MNGKKTIGKVNIYLVSIMTQKSNNTAKIYHKIVKKIIKNGKKLSKKNKKKTH